MMVNGLLVRNKEKEQTSLLMGILMLGSTQMESQMAKEYIIGRAVVNMKGYSKMD